MKEIDIEEVKKLEFDILKFVDDFCTSNSLTYFLCGGTLIGALRHKGFIPWDDDIDIMMPRDDYEFLLENFPKHAYYKVLSSRHEINYPMAFASVNDIRTRKVESKFRNKCNCLCVNVDIFPIDVLPQTSRENERFFNGVAWHGNMVFSAVMKYGMSDGLLKTVKKNFGILLFRTLELFHVSSVRKRVRDFEKFSQKYNDIESDYRGVASIYHYGLKETNRKEDLYPPRKVEFEGFMFNAPAHAEEYLSRLYGDFMKMPPVEARVTHHKSNCYWR